MKKFSFILVIFLSVFPAYAIDKHVVEQKIKNVKAKIEQKKASYIKMRQQYSTLMSQISKVDKSVKYLKYRIKVNKKDLRKLNKRIDNLKKDIGSVSKQLNEQKQRLRKEFREYYEYSRIGEFYKQGVWYEYMNAFVSEYMQNKIKKYIEKRTYLKNKLDTLNSYVKRKKRILDKIQKQEIALKKKMNELSILTARAKKNKEMYLKDIKQLSLEQAKLQGILQKIIEEEQRKKKEQARLAKKKSRIVSRSTNNIKTGLIAKEFTALRHKIQPPVSGKIIDTFGQKYDTVFKVYTRNDGIDIKAKNGICVKSIAYGKIDYIGNLPVYGGVIIVNHLNGYYTVYGGVTPVVGKGAIVKAYQCMAKLKSDRLHFELRRHAQAVNPLIFLDRRFLR